MAPDFKGGAISRPNISRPDNRTGVPKYAPRKSIYIDVDGVLLFEKGFNKELAAWIKKNSSAIGGEFDFVLWSSRGADHARRVAEALKITTCFLAILAKPGYIIDDRGFEWTAHVNNLIGEWL